MQHKSLFAALLCGALCLTACLKNEESPSVTLVRNAKAEELLANAAKLNAEAEATLILAKAEATLKEAQAKLQEANARLADANAEKVKAEAALVLAQAAYAQAEADLKKVEIDQEKAELQRMLEELKAQIAEYEARIAAANAEKTYWEYMKQILDKELEIALVDLQAELLRAQADLVAAQSAYNDAIRAAEQVEHQAEIDAADQAAAERQALRDKVEELLGKYYAAAAELLDIEHDLIHEQMLITEAEEGIATANEIKGEMIEYNNREIARLQKVVDYLKSLEGADPEDLKDQLTDLFIAIDEQDKKVKAAEEAYYEVFDQMALNAPNEAGDTPGYVTYTYTEKFFNPDTSTYIDVDGDGYGDVTYPVLYDLPMYNDYQEYDENGDPTFYHGFDWYGSLFDEDGVYYEYYAAYDYNYATGDYDNIEFYELYNYFWGYTGYVGMKETPVRYPALGEGISFDEREPYTNIDTYQFFPLEINREGYQAYTDFLNAALNAEVDQIIADENVWIDGQIEALTSVKEKYQAFLDTESVAYQKMDEKIENTVDQFITDYEALKAKIDEYNAGMNEYIKTYEIDNNVERTEALIAYKDAADAWQKLIDEKPANLESDVTTAALKIIVGALALAVAEQQKEDFENNEGGAYDNWQYDLANAKIDAGNAEGYYNAGMTDLNNAQSAYDLAKKAYDTQVELFDKATETYYTAMQNYADAYELWAAAGWPSPDPLEDAVTATWNAYMIAWTAQSDANTALAPLQSAMVTAEADLEAAKAAVYGPDGTGETSGLLYDFNQAKEELQKQLDVYPKSFDDKIAECEKFIADSEAEFNAAKEANDAYDAKIQAAEDAKTAAFEAWKKVAGDDAKMTELNNLLTDIYTSVAALGDPVYDLLFKYGVISSMDWGYDESDLPYIFDNSEALEYAYYAPWASYLASDFDPEEYVKELIWEAGYEYFSNWIPSAAWNLFQQGTENSDYFWSDPDAIDYSFVDWDWDVNDMFNYMGQSPMGIWFMCNLLNGSFADGSMDNAVLYSEYLSVDGIAALIEDYDVVYRQDVIDYYEEARDYNIACNNIVMTEVDDILQYEDVYKAAIEELNALAEQLPDLQIAWWEESLAFTALQDEINQLYFVEFADAKDLADRIAQYEQDIKDLEDENADWSAITEMEHALTKLKGIYELDQVEYEVKKAICEDLKAEFEAAFAELKGE